MRRICWDVDRLTCAYHLLRATEGGHNLALKHSETFFKVMAMRRRPAIRGHMHVNQAKSARCVFAGEKDSVGIPSQPNVGSFCAASGCAKTRLRSRLSGGIVAGDCPFVSADISVLLHRLRLACRMDPKLINPCHPERLRGIARSARLRRSRRIPRMYPSPCRHREFSRKCFASSPERLDELEAEALVSITT